MQQYTAAGVVKGNIKKFDGGGAVFTLRVPERQKQADGSYKNGSAYVDVSVSGKNAEFADRFALDNTPIIVTGTPSIQQYTSKTGEAKAKLRVFALTLNFAPRPFEERAEDAPF